MADFLANATVGGATAASQLYATLRMTEHMLLLDLGLSEKLCKGCDSNQGSSDISK